VSGFCVLNYDDIVRRFNWKVTGLKHIICPGAIITTVAVFPLC